MNIQNAQTVIIAIATLIMIATPRTLSGKDIPRYFWERILDEAGTETLYDEFADQKKILGMEHWNALNCEDRNAWDKTTVFTAQRKRNGEWGVALNPSATIAVLAACPKNWSAYNEVGFSLYSATNNYQRVRIFFNSSSAAGWGAFVAEFTIDWIGWRTLSFALPSLGKRRTPEGWEKIESVTFMVDAKDFSIKGDTDLVLDAITLSTGSVPVARYNGKRIVRDLAKRPHPRVILTPSAIDRMRRAIADSPQMKTWYEELRAYAVSNILSERGAPPFKANRRGNMLMEARRLMNYVYGLGILYFVEDELDDDIFERLWSEVEGICDYPHWWHENSYLNTAEWLHAFAVFYDWFYDRLTRKQRETMRAAMIEKGHEIAFAAYRDNEFWTYDDEGGNWSFVCNGGNIISALAIGDEEPELAARVFAEALPRFERTFHGLRDGAAPEGPMYWAYIATYTTYTILALESATGSDFGLWEKEGLREYGSFIVRMHAPSGKIYNFGDSVRGDAGPFKPQWPLYVYHAKYDKPLYVWYQRNARVSMGAENVNRIPLYEVQNLFFSALYPTHTNVSTARIMATPLDHLYERVQVATFRSAWEDDDAFFLGLKGGGGFFGHAHLDAGSFDIQAFGVDFAYDRGPGDYNLPGYFVNKRYTYYITRAEGHNTLVVNPGRQKRKYGDQRSTLMPKNEAFKTAEGSAFYVVDLLPLYAYEGVTRMLRGGALVNGRRQFLIQDEIDGDGTTEIYWFLHTKAKEIQIATNGDDKGVVGRSAVLVSDEKRLHLRILSDCGAGFRVMPVAPLPTSPATVEKFSSREKKLAIHIENAGSNATIAVLATPLRPWDRVPTSFPSVTPLARWSVDDKKGVPLTSLTVDGKQVEGFSGGILTYDIHLPQDAQNVPEVRARAKGGVRVNVVLPSRIPGTAKVFVGDAKNRYYAIHFWRTGEEYSFYSKKTGRGALSVKDVTASAYNTNAGAEPKNTLDGSLVTRWAVQGDPHWIRFDLGVVKDVRAVGIAWFKGDERQAIFDIELSDNGETWKTVYSGYSYGETYEEERYDLPEGVRGRYVRIVGHGNSANAWNTIQEVVIYGE